VTSAHVARAAEGAPSPLTLPTPRGDHANVIPRWLPAAAMALALSGCKQKAYEHDCTETIKALGVGFENVSTPRDEAARDKQIAATASALERWGPTRASLTLDDVRTPAAALAADLDKRKPLLAAAKFAVQVPAPTGSERKDALAKAAAEALGKTIDKASGEALAANEKQYHADFEAVMAVCVHKF
jgi:hypothetical protein